MTAFAPSAGLFLVRQYRPNYCTGFEDAVHRGVAYADICTLPFCARFRHSGFKRFSIEPYHGDELIISAHYADGKSWVVGFALPENSTEVSPNGDLMRDNWRYKGRPSE